MTTTNKEKEDRAKKYIAGVVVFIILVFAAVIYAAAQQKAYHIVLQTNKPANTEVKQAYTTTEADSLITEFTGKPFNTKKQLSRSPFCYTRYYNQSVFVEKKRIKVKKNGKVKLKKWKK